MKKKLVTLLLAASMVMTMAACGGEKEPEADAKEVVTETTPDQKEEKEPEEGKEMIPSGEFSDMGPGAMYVVTAGGSTQDGIVPVLFVGKGTALVQIGYDTEDMDGSKLSFIYIDGALNSKMQLATGSGSFDLEGDLLKEGVHKVEVLQFEDDDPTGAVVTYKTGSYEVKPE